MTVSYRPFARDADRVIGCADDDGYTQHYSDSRGVVRIYAMTSGDGTWTLGRTKADFTP